jgi:hypothetical protein
MAWILEVAAAMRAYRRGFGRFPNLLFPRTFNEKLTRGKLVWRSPLMPLFVDKFLAKEFMAEKFGADLITPNLYAGDWLPPREERNWPLPYVIKTNHGSGTNIFVRSEADLDCDAIEAKLRKWLAWTYGQTVGEWAYSQVPRKVLVEPFIGDPSTTPLEYKFHTYGGRVRLISMTVDRYGDHQALVYDRDWNVAPMQFGKARPLAPTPPPADLERMIDIADQFGRRLPICRIDFYHVDGRARFGEVTVYSGSGSTPMYPAEYDRIIGDWIPPGRPARAW